MCVSAWLRASECESVFVRVYVCACVRAYVFVCANVWGRAHVPACACMRVNECYASFYHKTMSLQI